MWSSTVLVTMPGEIRAWTGIFCSLYQQETVARTTDPVPGSRVTNDRVSMPKYITEKRDTSYSDSLHRDDVCSTSFLCKLFRDLLKNLL